MHESSIHFNLKKEHIKGNKQKNDLNLSSWQFFFLPSLGLTN